MNDNFDIERARLDLERERYQEDIDLRKREIELKQTEQERSVFRSPLFLAVIAAVVGLFSNAIVALINGNAQRELEREKASATRQLEEGRAEAARILEALKTGDPDKAAENLKLLIETDLVEDKAKSISKYLANRTPGEGASLPAPGTALASTASATEIPSFLRLILPDWKSVHSMRKPVSEMTEEEAARLGRAIVKLKTLKKGDIRSFDTLARIYWGKDNSIMNCSFHGTVPFFAISKLPSKKSTQMWSFRTGNGGIMPLSRKHLPCRLLTEMKIHYGSQVGEVLRSKVPLSELKEPKHRNCKSIFVL